MNSSNGARIGRAEKALDRYQDANDALIRFVRFWAEHVVGNPGATAYVAHIRAAAARGRRRIANGEPADPAARAASVAAFQALMDRATDEEIAARQRVVMQQLLEAHECGEFDESDCHFYEKTIAPSS